MQAAKQLEYGFKLLDKANQRASFMSTAGVVVVSGRGRVGGGEGLAPCVCIEHGVVVRAPPPPLTIPRFPSPPSPPFSSPPNAAV